MSGEIVVVSAFGHTVAMGAPLLGAIYLGSLVYQEVKARQQEQQRQALLAAERLHRQIEGWHEQQKQQHLAMESAAQHWLQASQRLQSMRVDKPVPTERDASVQAQGFLQHADQQADQAKRLAELDALLDELPDVISEQAGEAFVGLRTGLRQLQEQMIQGPPPLASAIDSLQQALESTIEQQREQLAKEPALLQLRLREAEQLLLRLASTLPLAEGEEAEAISALLQTLQHALQNGKIGADDLARINESASGQIDQALIRHENRLVEQQLGERLGLHLQAMGYRALSGDEHSSLWGIPGGEQVHAMIQPGLRLAFQLQHERFQASDRSLDRAEIALLRQQEKRWCSDLKLLMERLNADGFRFQVDFEREIPEESVPIVVVEDVDEILRQTESLPRMREQS